MAVKFIAARRHVSHTKMAQCLGRLVKDTPKGINMLSFEQGGLFHLPLRCEIMTRSGDLCDNCYNREKKTLEKLADISGTTIGGSHPSYLMGRVTDPVPYWSRLYGSAWFNLKMESGCTLSKGNMAKIRKAVEKAYEGVEIVPPQPMPGVRKKALPTIKKEVTEPIVTVAPKKRIDIKRPLEPVAHVGSAPVDASEYEILEVAVKEQRIDDRLFYLDPKKDKLYDTKFMYVGRLKAGAIVAHPDSDAD